MKLQKVCRALILFCSGIFCSATAFASDLAPLEKLSDKFLDAGWIIAIIAASYAAFLAWFGDGQESRGKIQKCLFVTIFFASIKWVVEFIKGIF